MTDWRRMEWQYWANRIVVWVLLGLILLDVDEVYAAFKYHFPWWDDVMMVISYPLTAACAFVKKYTQMYRIDL